MIIETKDIKKARKLIEKTKKEKKPVIILGQDSEFNRKILENKKVNILLSPENAHKKDKLKERDSGLNHILCKIAKKNNIIIGIDIESIKKEKAKERAKLLARIMQNIKLCKKAGTRIKAFNFQDKINTFSLLLSLGMDTKTAKQAIEK